MKKRAIMKKLSVIVFAAGLTAPCFIRAQTTGLEIQKKSMAATRLAGSEVVATLLIIDAKGRTRERTIAQISKLFDKGNTEKKLIRFLSPPDIKGTGFLVFDYRDESDDKWISMPALEKTRRIISSENAKSFMGSEFSYADISLPSLDNFIYSILGEEDIGGVPCWKISILPADDETAHENGYSKKIAYIGKHDFVLRRALYFDLEGDPYKELTVGEIKELDTINHKYRILHMEMENKKNGRRAILHTDQIRFNPDVKDDYFTQRYLVRQ